MHWEPVIGLELHTQLATKSKIFSGASTAYGAKPNTQACAVDLGLPGVLPVLNAEAVRMAVKFAIAVNATVARRSVFARKNYFYPDLPKGYQISQYELPIVKGGEIIIQLDDGSERRIRITRAHLEEDAGKSIHGAYPNLTGIDLNRAGTPLIEIVSEPDMRSAGEASSYMRKVHSIVRYLGICDGNMQEGSFRCDANVSVRPAGESRLGVRAELKNLNSFRFVERAIEYEIERQIEVLEGGGNVVQETRLYDPQADRTRSMRSKEEANDYRYFPDPDLLPVVVTESFIDELRLTMPELPDAKRHRFMESFGLNAYDAGILTASRELAEYFEETVATSGASAKICANWITGEVAAALNRTGVDITQIPMTPALLGGLLRRIDDETISGKIAKQVFDAMWEGEGDADDIIEARGLRQVTDTAAIGKLVDEVIKSNPDQANEYRAGKYKVIGYFVGLVMKASQGKANPALVNEMLKEKLGDG